MPLTKKGAKIKRNMTKTYGKMMFGSIMISGFAEQRAEWFENRRHPDDNFRKDFGLDPLDDEIPF